MGQHQPVSSGNIYILMFSTFKRTVVKFIIKNDDKIVFLLKYVILAITSGDYFYSYSKR